MSVKKLQLHRVSRMAVSQEVPDPGKHLVAGSLGRQCEVESPQPGILGPVTGQLQRRLGFTLARGGLDDDYAGAVQV